MTPPKVYKKVAVVAIHGIGGPPPGVTARRVSEALAETETEFSPTSPPTATCEAIAIRGAEAEGGEYPENVYHTVRYSQPVTVGKNGPQCVVDIYEIHWADLSRAGATLRRLPLDILELAFFPLHLADQAFAAERDRMKESQIPAARAVRRAHYLFGVTIRILAGILPPCFVFMLTRLLLVLLAHTPTAWPILVACGLIGLAVFTVGLLIRIVPGAIVGAKPDRPKRGWPFALVGLALGIPVAVAVGLSSTELNDLNPEPLKPIEMKGGKFEFAGLYRYQGSAARLFALAVITAELGWSAACWGLARGPLRGLLPPSFGRYYHYWWRFAIPLLATADYVLAVAFDDLGSVYFVSSVAGHGELMVALGLCGGWFLLSVSWVIALLAAAAGVAVFRLGGERWRAVPLWVPTSLVPYLVITSVVYLGAVSALLLCLPDRGAEFATILAMTGINAIPVALVTAGALTCLFPLYNALSLLAFRRENLTHLDPTEREAKRQYRLMDVALRTLPWAIAFAFIGATLGSLIGTSLRILDTFHLLPEYLAAINHAISDPFHTKAASGTHVSGGIEFSDGPLLPHSKLGMVYVFFAALAFSLFFIPALTAVSPQLSVNTFGLKTLIDLVFDVLNYLRGNKLVFGPAASGNATKEPEPPLATRIYRRYEAVLSAVQTGGYDAVLVLAHSQGTAITFDLFSRNCAEGGAKSPVRLSEWPKGWMLVTFGSPIRQLYGGIFPTQYVRDDLDDLAKNTKIRWWNLFFGNDFVGRHLLTGTARYEYAKTARKVTKLTYRGGGLKEACIGVGGHTAYWGNPTLVGHVIRRCLRVLV